jgi:cyclopropane fatty-acyl-phospholipid synthase-like methyltransferase
MTIDKENTNVSKTEQYDSISKEYAELVEADPSKKFVQYPSALRLLGDVSQKSVLDIGSGNGIFARELARRGATVTGYDISAEQVANAQKAEQAEPLQIEYSVSNPLEFSSDKKFDKAVSVLVLLYAADKKYLEAFFSSTNRSLKDDGEFVSVIFNPRFKRFGEILYNRRFTKIENGKIKVEFFNQNQVTNFSAEFSDFTAEDYEQAAKDGGFAKSEWKNLKIEELGMQELGQDFWKDYEEDCPYIGFVVYKS